MNTRIAFNNVKTTTGSKSTCGWVMKVMQIYASFGLFNLTEIKKELNNFPVKFGKISYLDVTENNLILEYLVFGTTVRRVSFDFEYEQKEIYEFSINYIHNLLFYKDSSQENETIYCRVFLNQNGRFLGIKMERCYKIENISKIISIQRVTQIKKTKKITIVKDAELIYIKSMYLEQIYIYFLNEISDRIKSLIRSYGTP
ncbi:MAG: hypothetical protein LH606_11490 [Cytophagaceae bacterium]|nr:hypothetical protein [Cytophagaceae bacterium]